jgi:hypothetical protein
LKLEAVRSFKTLVFAYKSTECHNPEDLNISIALKITGLPIECDDFQIAVLFNRVVYELRQDHGESIVKSHYLYVCAFYILKLHLESVFPVMQLILTAPYRRLSVVRISYLNPLNVSGLFTYTLAFKYLQRK